MSIEIQADRPIYLERKPERKEKGNRQKGAQKPGSLYDSLIITISHVFLYDIKSCFNGLSAEDYCLSCE